MRSSALSLLLLTAAVAFPSRAIRFCKRRTLVFSSTATDGGTGRSTAEELAVMPQRRLPLPSVDFGPQDVALLVCRGLQANDAPNKDEGLRRAFAFMTWECRKAVTARQGADTVERFVEYGSRSPMLLPLIGAASLNVQRKEDVAVIPGTPTRGAMCTVRVDAWCMTYGASLSDSVGGGSDSAELSATTYAVQLQQERRPPMSGCWLIRDLVDVRFAFAGDAGVDTSE